MGNSYITQLLEKYLNDEIGPEELERLFASIEESSEKETWLQFIEEKLQDRSLHGFSEHSGFEKIPQKIIDRVGKMDERKVVDIGDGRVKQIKWYHYISAAVILLLIGTGLDLLLHREDKHQENSAVFNNTSIDLLPAKSIATLTLANGTTIDLNGKQEGVLARQGNVKIVKNESGRIEYQPSNGTDGITQVSYNKLETSKGGKYQLALPDGSKVWLNAASSIEFPTFFTGKSRQVRVTGEAYFEVAKNKGMPFVVNAKDKFSVKVLGTHFNVNVYDDEPSLKTTLVEGAIEISDKKSSRLMEAGEQAVVSSDGEIVLDKDVDMGKVLAWKNNFFYFAKDDVYSIMREISRWYNVSVEFNGSFQSLHFSANISRDNNISQVMKMLEQAGGLNIKMEKGPNPNEGKIIISP